MGENQPAVTMAPLSRRQAILMLAAAFLGWMFAGLQISLFVLIGRPALLDLLGANQGTSVAEDLVKEWLSWYQAAFLFGAAIGGWGFGWLGDAVGRTRTLGLSILCYSVMTGAGLLVHDPLLLLFCRFLACLGIGGTWPSAVALAAEAWPDASRPWVAGLLGTAANFGFVLFGIVAYFVQVTPTSWRWALILASTPAVLALICLTLVPESTRWLLQRNATAKKNAGPFRELVRPPLRSRVILGTLLGAVAVVGTAANANWITPWSDQAAEQQALALGSDAPVKPDYRAKAVTQITRSSGAILGSLLGGVLATMLGRRLTYFSISLLTLAASTIIYGFLDPLHPWFHPAAFLLGFFGVLYFGWLPLFLPELFPTRVRSTGAGIAFNSGRFVAAFVTLFAVALARLSDFDYARLGLWTGCIYAVGMLVIFLVPRTEGGRLED